MNHVKSAVTTAVIAILLICGVIISSVGVLLFSRNSSVNHETGASSGRGVYVDNVSLYTNGTFSCTAINHTNSSVTINDFGIWSSNSTEEHLTTQSIVTCSTPQAPPAGCSTTIQTVSVDYYDSCSTLTSISAKTSQDVTCVVPGFQPPFSNPAIYGYGIGFTSGDYDSGSVTLSE